MVKKKQCGSCSETPFVTIPIFTPLTTFPEVVSKNNAKSKLQIPKGLSQMVSHSLLCICPRNSKPIALKIRSQRIIIKGKKPTKRRCI